MENKTIYDVIIIGGGLSGLKSAYDLKKLNFNILVLEARNRFGGRTESIKVDNGWIDFGGQWFGNTHFSIKELVSELNLKTYKQYYKGKTVVHLNHDTYNNGKESIKSYDEESIELKDLGLNNIELIFNKIDYYLKNINFDNLSNQNNELINSIENISVNQWIQINGFEEYSNFFNWFCKMNLAVSFNESSFLFFLKYIKSCGGGMKGVILSNNDECSEESRVIGGSQIISDKMVEFIKIENCKLNSEVISIDQRKLMIGKDGEVVGTHNNLNKPIITIKTKNNDIYYCKDIIITIPIPLLKNIEFLPELPNKKRKLVNKMKMGNAMKVIIVYETAFWRDKGYNGKVLCFNNNEYPIFESFDNSTNDNSVNSIIGFIVGKDSIEYWLSKSFDYRKQSILNQYSNYWGIDALSPKYYFEKNWINEKYTKGCYMGVTPPGSDTTSLDYYYQKPFGNIHWAGTESSNQHYGYMEGAILSSKRVVNEIILKSLKNYKL